MLQRILVGHDGLDGGDDAAALARLLAGEGTVVTLAFIAPETPLPVDSSAFAGGGGGLHPELYERAIREDTERLAGTAERLLEGLEHTSLVIPGGSPTHALHDLAEGERYDLLIVGSTRRGAVGRVVPGSIARRLLAGAPCPLAIAPRGLAEDGPERLESILVGYDESDEAEIATEMAAALARDLGTPLTLLGVAEPIEPPSANPAWATLKARHGSDWPVENLSGHELQATVNDRAESLGEGIEASGEAAVGEPVEELLNRAEGPGTLLVLGSRGYGPVRRVLLGSTAASIADDAPCALLIVPRPH